MIRTAPLWSRLAIAARAALGLVGLVLLVSAGVAAASAGEVSSGADRYVTPEGTGARDGSDWANALPATSETLQQAWDALPPGGTLFVGSGVYGELALRIAAGGEADAPRTLRGVDTGDGLPLFQGNWSKAAPSENLRSFIDAKASAHHWAIRDLRVDAYSTAVRLRGPNEHVRIENVDVERSRDAIVLAGGGADAPSRHIRIRDCDFHFYTKRAVRIRGGVSDVEIRNCHADAGGEPWAVERFVIGFHIMSGEDGPNHDILFADCTARNHYDDNGEGYWNADGFAAEAGNHAIRYERCGSFDNTDGGWDDKSTEPVYIDCTASGNKRNFRIWNGPQPARFTGCVSREATKLGGSGDPAGLWLGSDAAVAFDRGTFADNPTAFELEDEGPNHHGSLIVRESGVSIPANGEVLRGPESGLEFIETQVERADSERSR